MKLVIIESPFAGNKEANTDYALECMHDAIRRGEAPFASHLFYTLFLDDNNPAERTLGIEAGLAWGRKADLTAVYTDLGISRGMQIGIMRAVSEGRQIVYRKIRSAKNPKHFQETDKD